MTASTIDREAADRRPDDPAARLALLGLCEPPAVTEHRIKIESLTAGIERRQAARDALSVTIDASEAAAAVAAATKDGKAAAAAREAVRTAKRDREDHADAALKLLDERDSFRLVELRDHDADVRELDIRRRQVEALETLAPLAAAMLKLGEDLRSGIAAAHAVSPASAPQLMRDVARMLKPGTSVRSYNLEQVPERLLHARRALAEAVTDYRRKWGV